MADIGFALEAKSDQLNAVDIIGAEPVIRIKEVRVAQGDQAVSVFFDGDNGKPWKPCKGMLRVLAGAWGRESDAWIGRRARLFFEPSVRYGGQEVGGIRIRALSDIDYRGLQFALRVNQKKTEPFHVALLVVEEKPYPAARFDKALPLMAEKLRAGDMTLQQVIAQCQKTGTLTADQLARLEAAAPVEIQSEDDEVM